MPYLPCQKWIQLLALNILALCVFMHTHSSRAVSADPADGSPHDPLFCTMKRDQQSSGAVEQERLCCSQTNVGCTSCQMPAYTSQQSGDMWQGRVGDRHPARNAGALRGFWKKKKKKKNQEMINWYDWKGALCFHFCFHLAGWSNNLCDEIPTCSFLK